MPPPPLPPPAFNGVNEDSEYVPAGHASHADAPPAATTEPAGHSSQAAAAGSGL